MAEEKKEKSLIDPIYQRFAQSVVRSLSSTEFYAFFMDSLSRADNEIQFSNRKMIKSIDTTWIDAIEESLKALQNIIASPRNVIKEEELIVNVANAKKMGSETVRHLATHSDLVEYYNEEEGEVRPERLMQRYKEESIGLYENRLVYTTMENAFHFVKIRHDALLEAMSDEYGAKLKVKSEMESTTEHMHFDMFIHIKNVDSPLDTDEKNADAFSRISRLYRVLGMFMASSFAEQLSKLPRIKGNVSATNVLKKNKDYKVVMKLFNFLREYDQIGYTIKVVEQSPRINEKFQKDIYHNILFNYLVLKGYLEDEEDRAIPAKTSGRKKTLKPRFIHEIVEELTQDYDLPDVEIRKVLIEELTKEQLMKEEAAERRRLVEEREQKKKEEAERLKAQKKAEAERIKAEKAAERERLRKEKEAEEARKFNERMEREAEERRVKGIYEKELDYFSGHLEMRLEMRRRNTEENENTERLSDYIDAVKIVEEEEQRRREEKLLEKKRRQQEREKQRQLWLLKQEEERKARLEEEKRQSEEQQKKAREEEERLKEEAYELMKPFISELIYFSDVLPYQKKLRERVNEQEKIRFLVPSKKAEQKEEQAKGGRR